MHFIPQQDRSQMTFMSSLNDLGLIKEMVDMVTKETGRPPSVPELPYFSRDSLRTDGCICGHIFLTHANRQFATRYGVSTLDSPVN